MSRISPVWHADRRFRSNVRESSWKICPESVPTRTVAPPPPLPLPIMQSDVIPPHVVGKFNDLI